MLRLLYISTARAPLPASALQQLLAISRRNNGAVGVTGLLLGGGTRFMQVLEGPQEHVDATFERIRRDPRHFAVVMLAKSVTDARLFDGWSMGFQPSRSISAAATVAEEVAALVQPIADPNVRAYFDGFARQHAA